MSATQPTRRPWHSITDAIWANAAAAGDVESAPADGEIIAGHVNNTGYTSGRANWLWACVAEWFQKVRAVLLPQHTDAGGHYAVTIVGVVGAVKLDVQFNLTDVATTPAAQVSYGGTPMTDYRLDGNWRNQNGYYLSTGTMVLGANDFTPVGTNLPNDFTTFDRDAPCSYLYANLNDSNNYYAATHRIELAPGTRITLITLAGNRPTAGGQVLTLELLSRTIAQVGATVEATFVLGAGTGEISTGSGALTITTSATKVYYLRATFNNNTPGGGNEILLRGVTITFDCP